MFRRVLVAAVLILAATSSSIAQTPVQRWPTRGGGGGGGGAQEASPAPAPAERPSGDGAASRPVERRAEPRREPRPAPERTEAPPAPQANGGGDRGGGRVAVPRTRPVPRDRDARDNPRSGPDRRRGDTNVYIGGSNARRYYYPRRVYPYGYGGFGLGYFYYDPYGWYPGSGIRAYGAGAYGPGYYGYGHNDDIGEVRLRVTPRDAQVYVDGYFAGTVDDFDGILQGLRLESGPYHVEIVLPGYETLEFDVRVNPGQKVTYREEMRRTP